MRMQHDSVPENSFEVGVIVAKRKLKGPWASHAWLPCAVLPGAAAAAPWTRLTASDEEETFYAGSFEVSLYPSETAHYRDNLTSGRPSLWVALRTGEHATSEIATVTADPMRARRWRKESARSSSRCRCRRKSGPKS